MLASTVCQRFANVLGAFSSNRIVRVYRITFADHFIDCQIAQHPSRRISRSNSMIERILSAIARRHNLANHSEFEAERERTTLLRPEQCRPTQKESSKSFAA